MATAVGIGGSVFTSDTFLGDARALSCGIGWTACILAITAIDANPSVVYFARTAVRFASVAFHAKQLNVGGHTGSTAREGHDVIIFQVHGASAALTNASVSGEDNLFGRFRDIPALRKTSGTHQEQRQ